MNRKDRVILKLVALLEEGSDIMYDCFSERDGTIKTYFGHVPPEVKWAEDAKRNAKQAQAFVARNLRE